MSINMVKTQGNETDGLLNVALVETVKAILFGAATCHIDSTPPIGGVLVEDVAQAAVLVSLSYIYMSSMRHSTDIIARST